MRWVWYLFVASSILIMPLVGISEYLEWGILSKVIPICIYVSIFLLTNHSAKNVLKNKHHVYPSGFPWAGSEYEKIRIRLLRDFLRNKNLLSMEKLKLMIELLYKRAEKSKPSGLIGAGLFLALFVPVWSEFIKLIYDNSFPLNQAVNILVILAATIAVVLGFLHMIQTVVFGVVDSEGETMRNLARILEEILLTF
jgi:hypothetical protein